MRISDWSSDVCSSDLRLTVLPSSFFSMKLASRSSFSKREMRSGASSHEMRCHLSEPGARYSGYLRRLGLLMKSVSPALLGQSVPRRSEEHTSALQSLMRHSYAVFCLKKKIKERTIHIFAEEH